MKIVYYEGEEFSEGKWHPIRTAKVDVQPEEMSYMPDETWYAIIKLIERITANLTTDEKEKEKE